MKNVVLILLNICVSFASLAAQATKPDLVELSLSDRQAELTASERTQLRDIAVRLVESSNFNSQAKKQVLVEGGAKLQGDYRQTVHGDFLLVVFPEARTFQTIGGKVEVREIVVGLAREDYAFCLYTIDGEDRLVNHSKYAGVICIELMHAAKAAAVTGKD